MNERRCKICGKILEDWEDDICKDDQASMLQKDGIDLGLGEDFV
jgi:hypothetical protein